MPPTDQTPSPAVSLNRVTTHAQRLLDALVDLDAAGGLGAAAAATSPKAAGKAADWLKLAAAECQEAVAAFHNPRRRARRRPAISETAAGEPV
jgi:hypothetical protein